MSNIVSNDRHLLNYICYTLKTKAQECQQQKGMEEIVLEIYIIAISRMKYLFLEYYEKKFCVQIGRMFQCYTACTLLRNIQLVTFDCKIIP